MPEFQSLEGGAILVLDDVEAALLQQLTAEVSALLTGAASAAPSDQDPVMERLFPRAYDDPSEESSYRDMVRDDLTREKLRALDVVSTAVENATEIAITGEDFDTWMACLTDLRLAIGTRLDVDEERMGADIDPRDPDAQAMSVLHWLGWMQEGLLRAAAA